MSFITYGPFKLQDLSRDGIDELYEKFDEAHRGLEAAVGIYIVACMENGKLLPWYVGKSDNSLGARLIQHFKVGTFQGIHDSKGSLHFFLIPHITRSGKLKKKSKNGNRKVIDRLEFALIGTCLAKNPELLNKQETTFHASIKVPGYWNSTPVEQDASAKALAKLLRAKS